jgi:hypothetical protein
MSMEGVRLLVRAFVLRLPHASAGRLPPRGLAGFRAAARAFVRKHRGAAEPRMAGAVRVIGSTSERRSLQLRRVYWVERVGDENRRGDQAGGPGIVALLSRQSPQEIPTTPSLVHVAIPEARIPVLAPVAGCCGHRHRFLPRPGGPAFEGNILTVAEIYDNSIYGNARGVCFKNPRL